MMMQMLMVMLMVMDHLLVELMQGDSGTFIGANSLVLRATVEQLVVAPSRPHDTLVQTRRVEQVLALHSQVLPGLTVQDLLTSKFVCCQLSNLRYG